MTHWPQVPRFRLRARRVRALAMAMTLLIAAPPVAQADPLDDQIQAAMKEQGTPGLTLAVVQHGRIVRLGAYGLGNVEWGAKATDDTRFEIASISKLVTGAAARLLIEDGQLDPDDPVSKYLPGGPPSWAAMKVRHLITMSSGLPEDFGNPAIPYDADVNGPGDDTSMLAAFQGLPFESAPGVEFHYSGPGYAMLGMIVAQIAGEPLAAFVNRRIFAPAGMTESTYIDNVSIVPRRADGYRRKDGTLVRGHFLGQYLHSRADVGVLTTARDLAKLIIALEQRKIVKDPEPLWAGATSDTGRPLDYAYGWGTGTLLGHRQVSHTGGYRTGFHTVICRYPDDDLSVVVLTNCDFSNIRRLALLATAAYLGDSLMKPLSESVDPDAARTAALIAGMQGVAGGKLDDHLFTPDALEPLPLAEVAEFLKSVKEWAYAGSGRLPAPGMQIHGHTAVDFVTLRMTVEADAFLLTLYRDVQGRVVYVELTT